MANNENDERKIGTAYLEKWREERNAAKEKLSPDLKEFLKDSTNSSNSEPSSPLYLEFVTGMKDGTYKKPSDFFKKKCGGLFEGVIYPRRAEDFYYIADHIQDRAYSASFYRRSLRTAEPEILCKNIMDTVYSLYERDHFDADICDIIEEKNLTEEQLCHKKHNYYSFPSMDEVIAAEIDMGNERLIKIISDIIMCESGISVDSVYISAVTMCHNAGLHEKLGKLLLAARLQEGLRQSICEKMDTGTKEAFFTLLDVILENNLIRFSSVKRAVGTWLALITDETAKLDRISDKSIELIAGCLRDESFRDECLASEDSMKIYIGLWSIGFYDTVKMLDRIREYSRSGSEHQLLVAGYMANELDNEKFTVSISKYVIKAHREHPQVLAVYVRGLEMYCDSEIRRTVWKNESVCNVWVNGIIYSEKQPDADKYKVRKYADLNAFYDSKEEAEEMYAVLKEIHAGLKTKEKVFSPCIFPWNTEKLERSSIAGLLAFTASALRDNDRIDEAAALIPQIDGGRGLVLELLLTQPETAVQRHLLTAEICDKEEYTRGEAIKVISYVDLEPENYLQLEDMLRYKNADMRAKCIGLLMKQEDNELFGTVSRLISDKKEEKRTAALDMIIQLSKDGKRRELFGKCAPLAAVTENTTAAEKILIENISPGKRSADSTPALYSDEDIYTPVIDKDFIKKADKVFDKYFPEKDKKDPDWKTALDKLNELIKAHRDDEFRYGYSSETVTLGTAHSMVTEENGKLVLPFRGLWEEFYKTEIKSPVTLLKMCISLCSEGDDNELSAGCNKILEKIIGKPLTVRYSYDFFIKMVDICEYLLFQTKLDVGEIISISASFANRLSKLDSLWVHAKMENHYIKEDRDFSLINCYPVGLLLCLICRIRNDAELFKATFPIRFSLEQKESFRRENLYYGRAFYLTSHSDYCELGAIDHLWAAYCGIMTEKQMYRIFFMDKTDRSRNSLLRNALSAVSNIYAGARELTDKVDVREERWDKLNKERTFKDFIRSDGTSELTEEQQKLIKFGEQVYEKLVGTVLANELKRGDSPTEYTYAIDGIKRIYGIENLVKILCALGKLPLERSLYGDKKSKKGALSHFLGVCVPDREDNAAALEKALKGTGITEQRIIETAMYSPEWQPIVGEYLGWEGFSSACYYFIAHMNEEFDDKRKAVIAKYTPLTAEELNAGAFDINWFRSAYDTLGEKRFDMIYDAAKYISDGAKHSRARKYADAALGKLNAGETVKAISDKRNKDLLMAYALIPIKDEDDICTRYLYLQQFLKESKKFGSQRAASEKKAVETAMQNLSINAGYSDVTRLTLRMETKLIDDSRELFEEKEIESTVFRLAVNEAGKADIICTKGGKELKAIPAKLKKNEYVLRLADTKKKLTEQYRRTRAMFEQAMEESTEFTVDELDTLRSNPVVLPVIKYLVFASGKKMGFLDGSKLTDYSGKSSKLKGSDKVTVAHPFALYKDGHWHEYQKKLFDSNIVQPFKQVFRELYVKTAEEAEMTHSLRYAGNQIQPAKTVACLKSRRWVADVENGLQKVYYRDNIIAEIYAMADWFTPADIEAPTLEWVGFTDRKTGKPLQIKDIPDIIFSEVMRDVDLAVSVAHAGGVDPETSHSTIEMRSALIGFTLPLFKLTNVELKGSHAHIKGKYGEYTLHLGSGVIHKKGGVMINILPVHSQHRGKLFLPFADDDPKTAEIITKMLFLAEDDKIKDPYILEQLK